MQVAPAESFMAAANNSIRAQEAAVIIAHPVPNPPREET